MPGSVTIHLPGDEVAVHPSPPSGLGDLVAALRLAVHLAETGKGPPRSLLGLIELPGKPVPAADQGRTLSRLAEDVTRSLSVASTETEDWVVFLTFILGASRRIVGRALSELTQLHRERDELGEASPRLLALDIALRGRRRLIVAKGLLLLEALASLAAALEEQASCLDSARELAPRLPELIGECQRVLDLERRLLSEEASATPYLTAAPVLTSLADKLEAFRLACDKVHGEASRVAEQLARVGAPSEPTSDPAWLQPAVETTVRFDGSVEELDARIAAIRQSMSFDEVEPFVDLSIPDAPITEIAGHFTHLFASGLARIAAGSPLERARRLDRPAVWREILAFLPPGPLAEEIREAVHRWVSEAVDGAREAATLEAWAKVREFAEPGTQLAEEAAERCDFLSALAASRPAALQAYLARHPDGPGAAAARARQEEMAWVPDWASESGGKDAGCWIELDLSGERVRFRLLAAGTYLVHPAWLVRDAEIESRPMEATLTRPAWVAERPVSRRVWEGVGGGEAGPEGEDRPVLAPVSRNDVEDWLVRLRERRPDLALRMPSQVEWEAALCLGLFESVPPSGEWCQDGAFAGGEPVRTDPLGDADAPVLRQKALAPDAAGPARLAPANARLEGTGFRLVADATGAHDQRDALEDFVRPPRGAVYLGDLSPLRAKEPPGLKRAPGDAWGALSVLVGGRRTSAFVPLHAPSTVAWAIPPGTRRFTAVGAGAPAQGALHRSWSYRIDIDGSPVASTPPLYESRAGLPIDVPIPENAREMTVSVDPLGDADHDQAVIAWPYFHRDRVGVLSVIPDSAIFLGALTPKSARVGWGEYGVNNLPEPHHAVRLGGIRVERFLWMHAPAEVSWSIPPGARRFTAIGTRVDLDFTAHGTWRFVVLIDGKEVHATDPLAASPEGLPIDVWLPRSAEELTIRVDDMGDAKCDWSVLAFPCFRTAETEFRPGEAVLRSFEGRFVSLRAEGAGRLVAADAAPGPPARFELLETGPARIALRAASGRWVRRAEDGTRVCVDSLVPGPESEFALGHAGAGCYSFRGSGTETFLSLPLAGEPELVPRPAHGDAPAAFELLGRHCYAGSASDPPIPASHSVVRFALPVERTAFSEDGQDLVAASGTSRLRLTGGAWVEREGHRAIHFDGVSTHAIVEPPPCLSADLTIRMTFRLSAAPRQGWVSFFLCQSDADRINVRLCLANGRLEWVAPGGPALVSRAEITPWVRHTVVLAVEGPLHRLYLDGQLQGGAARKLDETIRLPLFVGRRFAGEGWSYLAGEISELSILGPPGAQEGGSLDPRPGTRPQGSGPVSRGSSGLAPHSQSEPS